MRKTHKVIKSLEKRLIELDNALYVYFDTPLKTKFVKIIKDEQKLIGKQINRLEQISRRVITYHDEKIEHCIDHFTLVNSYDSSLCVKQYPKSWILYNSSGKISRSFDFADAMLALINYDNNCF